MYKITQHPGYLIVYVMVFIVGLMSVGLVIMSLVSTTYRFTTDDVHRKNVAQMAEACANVIANELDEDPNFTSFSSGAETLYDRTGQNGTKATCVVDSITDGAGDTKIVQLTSYEYRSNNDSQPVSYQARAVLSAPVGGDNTHLQGGILVGNGGMTISGNGYVTSSRVNVLGRLTKSGSSYITVNNNGLLNVHNIGCNVSGTWPASCSGQPIVYSGNGVISGDICAPGQTNAWYLQYLNTSCTLPATAMPTFDKASFITGMTGPTINPSTITTLNGCWEQHPSYGAGTYRGKTYTIPANATINGTINLNSVPNLISGACTIVFQGNAYISGGISRTSSLGSGANTTFTISNSVSSNITIVMNRQMSIGGGSSGQVSFNENSTNKLAHIINFYSSNTTCSDSIIEPSSTVSTCLNASQAETSATNSTYASLTFNTSNQTRDFSGMTFYGYYSRITPCTSSTNAPLSIAAMAAQGLTCDTSGGYANLSFDNPTFGIPVPSGSDNHTVIDFTER